jgi:hypothetical protein
MSRSLYLKYTMAITNISLSYLGLQMLPNISEYNEGTLPVSDQ